MGDDQKNFGIFYGPKLIQFKVWSIFISKNKITKEEEEKKFRLLKMDLLLSYSPFFYEY